MGRHNDPLDPRIAALANLLVPARIGIEQRRCCPQHGNQRFAQFEPANLLGCAAGERYRKAVLEQGGSKPGRVLVRDFLGRDEEFAAFTRWLNEEFEAELAAS